MSAVAATPLPNQSQPPQIPQSVLQLLAKGGHVYVVGRCVSAKRAGTLFSHLIVMPAPDPYSSPSTVEVLAKSRQADSEQDVRLLCRLGGYKRSFKATDRETGETRQVNTADNKLFLVED